ncbi:hypothetical protein Moror_16765 [Moniliophthora roreri MCA 2997]|uniref:Uncharacterized protein n=1 Tax=Moniliophthora roreri (strain MCA 2997) TaxID=1381753 RepID=V2XQT4_MONRO|nr:hypothetical protein Moror_16765 [Moniliophthora roreri MCA 2997]
MNNKAPQDLITLNLPKGYESLPTPGHEDAGFFRLVWACLRTILRWFSIIAGNTGRTTTVTEQIALATTQLKNKEPKIDIETPDKYHGEPEKADAFINTLVLYFLGQRINNEANKVIIALSLITKGANDIAGNWADLQQN